MTVILPESTGRAAVGIAGSPEVEPADLPGGGYPTLWLLHGMSDDHTMWTRRTSIERYVSGLGIAVVMPGVDRSYYADMNSGPKYFTFVSEELPAVCRRMFRLSSRREDNFVAGLSMGGYGAMKLALNHPERYAAAAALSGALDVAALPGEFPERAAEWGWMFGQPTDVDGTRRDVFDRATQLKQSEHADLPLYLCCGTGDYIYQHTVRFGDHLRELGLNLTYEEHEGREHEWGYWDQQIQRVLEWLPLPQRAGEAE